MKRHIYPGEEWLYLKIYVSPNTANRVLIEVIMPLIKKLSEQKIIEQWFFIRYSDPNFHIRLRIKLNSVEMLGIIIVDFNKVIKKETDNGTVSKIQIDTYSRELERYGFETMEVCERFFYSDSKAVLLFLKNKPIEWEIIMECINWICRLYKELEFSDNEIYKFVDMASNSYCSELKLSADQIAEINFLYRKSKSDIIKAIKEDDSNKKWEIYNFGGLKDSINKSKIVSSLIHMHVNRIFSFNQRVYECIIYSLLKKSLLTLNHI